MALFKERGVIAFDKILSINSNERIPAITKTEDGRDAVLVALTASIKSAFSNLNLRIGCNEDQIIELADVIIDESHEDNLAIEDVLLFLQMLITGKAGKIYDRMDISTFLEKFEIYRQERHESLIRIREEQQAQYKSLGDPTDRWTSQKDEKGELDMREAMKEYMNLQYKKQNG